MDRRHFLQAATAAAVVALPMSALAGRGFDAIVAATPSHRNDGTPVYASIAAAIAAAPAAFLRPFRILVARGTWFEKLVVDKPGIELVGEHRRDTILRFDAAAGHLNPKGRPWATFGCASVIVRAPDFRLSRMTVMNGFDYLGHLREPKLEAIGAFGAQAVALMLDAGSDRALVEDADIIGHQDTLFTDAGRSLFRQCRISGSVDFIFGAGQAAFERCDIVSRFRPGKARQGYVAAPSTPATQAQGLSFLDCRLQREPEVPDRSVALGRAWRPTRNFNDGAYGDPGVLGKAVFVSCWMDAHIGGPAWEPMNYTAPGGARVPLLPGAARFYEYRSRGPGAAIEQDRRQLSAAEAAACRTAASARHWQP